MTRGRGHSKRCEYGACDGGRIETPGDVGSLRRAFDRSGSGSTDTSGELRVILASSTGRLEDAEALAEAAERSARHDRGRLGVYGLQMYFIRREQDRLDEVAPVLRLAAALEPDAPVWRPGLAALYVSTDMLDDARREFDHLASDDFASIPRDAMWPCCLTFLAEVCVGLGDRERAELLYRALKPFQGSTMMVGYTMCLGPADRFMGSLAAVAGRDGAEATSAPPSTSPSAAAPPLASPCPT